DGGLGGGAGGAGGEGGSSSAGGGTGGAGGSSGGGTGGGQSDGGRDAGLQGDGGIVYVVVIVKENHTFDNLFTGFPGASTSTTAKLSNGTTITRPFAPDGGIFCDVSHSNTSGNTFWDKGKMDGFDKVKPSQPDGGACFALQSFMRYREEDIPNYWAYARNFVLADNFFSTTMGPTWPGHFSTIAAQAPMYGNPTCTNCDEGGQGCLAPAAASIPTFNDQTCTTSTAFPCFEVPVVTDLLPAKYSWRAYGPGTAAKMFSPYNYIRHVALDAGVRAAHLKPLTTLDADLTGQPLANVTYIHVESGPGGISEHPPLHPCRGENYVVRIINKLMARPEWQQMAIIVTYDDFGGFYDHVPPPTADVCANGRIFNTGFRLPATLISPFARTGFVLHDKTEQASIPLFIEQVFSLPTLHSRYARARDDRAGSLMGAFNFAQPRRPPLLLQERPNCPR
ncbi:MAG: hypothetical protein K1X89_28110, partial [Myxococcaceae bacterium]|nr:hypothetical protein [Myxococcaceae bacterium]